MAFSRHLGVIGILGVSWFVAVGCGDDGDKNVAGDGGEAGEGGEASGGKSTSGGSANNAGKGGNAAAGKGGTANAGSGGTPTGGTAGSATIGGAGAGAVGGEDAGGAGGAPGPGGAGAGGVSAGAGGDGGVGGAPETAVAKKCDFGCDVDADCKRGNVPGHCDPTLKRCRFTDCTVSADCALVASNWFVPCANDSECAPDVERCVAWQDLGYCAGLPDPQFPDFPCAAGSPTTMPLFGAAGEAEVCAELTQVCSDKGQCEPGCGSLGCDAGTGDTCNPTTGICECAQSTECTKAGSSVCGGNGLCGCADDADCDVNAGVTGLGKCVNGTCGCDSPTTCVNPGYANATKVCE